MEPVSVESFLQRKVQRLSGKSNNRCGRDAVTSGSPAFSADDWGGPLPNSSFGKANLNSGLVPGKVSAFMSPAGSDWQMKSRGQVSHQRLWHHMEQLSSHLCSSQHRHQAQLRRTPCTARRDEGQPSPLQMPLPAALGTGSCWNRES